MSQTSCARPFSFGLFSGHSNDEVLDPIAIEGEHPQATIGSILKMAIRGQKLRNIGID
jgi:hypothetical protein